jgi:hypothetical protein
LKADSPEKAEKIHAEMYAMNLDTMNSIREIRPFLGEFPLTPSTFQVSIGFADGPYLLPDPPNIASLVMRPHQLEFNYFHKEWTWNRWEEFLTKPIKDCPLLQPYYHPNVKRGSPAKKPVVPTYSSTPVRYAWSYGDAMFGFSQKISAEKNLYLTALGDVIKDFELRYPFEIAFWQGNCMIFSSLFLS